MGRGIPRPLPCGQFGEGTYGYRLHETEAPAEELVSATRSLYSLTQSPAQGDWPRDPWVSTLPPPVSCQRSRILLPSRCPQLFVFSGEEGPPPCHLGLLAAQTHSQTFPNTSAIGQLFAWQNLFVFGAVTCQEVTRPWEKEADLMVAPGRSHPHGG